MLKHREVLYGAALAALTGALTLFGPNRVQAQCNQIFNPANCQTNSTTGAVACHKQFNPSGMFGCTTTAMGTGSTVCSIQSALGGTWRLWARKAVPTTTVQPQFCQWTCSCGAGVETFRIDGASDGLPVELLDFSIETKSRDPVGEERDRTPSPAPSPPPGHAVHFVGSSHSTNDSGSW